MISYILLFLVLLIGAAFLLIRSTHTPLHKGPLVIFLHGFNTTMVVLFHRKLRNGLIFREAPGNLLVMLTYRRVQATPNGATEPAVTVALNPPIQTIAKFSFVSIRSIAAIRCGTPMFFLRPRGSENTQLFCCAVTPEICGEGKLTDSSAVALTVIISLFTIVVLLGPCCCAFSAWFKNKFF